MDPARRHRRRDRLHGLHDAAGTGRRHAALLRAGAAPPSRTPGSKLWKHHAAQPEADRINAIAARARANRGCRATAARSRPSGSSPRRSRSSTRRPEIYAAADRLIEAADWVVWQLTGVETRNSLHRRLQGDVVEAGRLPGRGLLRRARPALRRVVDEKMSRDRPAVGRRGRRADAREAAALDRPRARHAVAVANVDAHVSVPAATVTGPGRMVVVMGTSICHLVLRRPTSDVEGMCGVVEDGVIPGFFGYEAGQSAVGDIFAWFVENARAAARTTRRPRRRGRRRPRGARAEAATLRPGRIRPAGARLVERQPLRARRRRPERHARRRDAGHDARPRSTAR